MSRSLGPQTPHPNQKLITVCLKPSDLVAGQVVEHQFVDGLHAVRDVLLGVLCTQQCTCIAQQAGAVQASSLAAHCCSLLDKQRGLADMEGSPPNHQHKQQHPPTHPPGALVPTNCRMPNVVLPATTGVGLPGSRREMFVPAALRMSCRL